MKYLAKTLLVFILMVNLSLFAAGSLGQSGANFLQISVEPRGAALGGAVTALSTGADALYWNPAGAVDINKYSVSLAHTDWFLDTKLTYGSAVYKISPNDALGISLTSFYMDEMEITNVYHSDGTGSYYNSGDLSAGLSYARRMTNQFSFGITGKYVHEYIWNETASQFALDVGSIYRADFLNLRLGMMVRNFAGKLKMEGDDIDERIEEEKEKQEPENPRIERLAPEFRLPQIFQMGVAIDVFDSGVNTVTVATDVNVPSDNQERFSIASEYSFRDLLFLRAAYKFNYDLASLALGGGIKYSGFIFDYSFNDEGIFGGIHRFGVKFTL